MKAEEAICSAGWCGEQWRLDDAEEMLLDLDCEALPVLDDVGSAVGVITERDITVRAVAEGQNPLEMTVGECMRRGVPAVSNETDLEECCEIMERERIPQLLVVDGSGRCCGVISQDDIARQFAGHDQSGLQSA